MRKAVAAFEQEFKQWGLTIPAQDIMDRLAGHENRHGWSLDYSFGHDAFGEYLEYHARRTVANEPVIERHARVYANGERNFVPAPPGAELPEPEFIQPDPNVIPSPARGTTKRPTLPPWKAMVEEASGENRHSMTGGTRAAPPKSKRTPAPIAKYPSSSSSNGGSSRSAPRSRTKHSAMSFGIGVGAAVLVAFALVITVRAVRSRKPDMSAAADTAGLEPVVVYAPAILGFAAESVARFTQPLVGTRGDPTKAEIVRPEHGMTPIIPSDPAVKRRNQPAATTRGEKFHVP